MYTDSEIIAFNQETMIVYKITNLINNKVYIGQTVRTFNLRYRGRGVGAERVLNMLSADSSKHINEHLYNSMMKYGVENFKVEIICKCKDTDELNEKEKYYIELYDSTNWNKGYNVQVGGDNKRWTTKKRLERNGFNEEETAYFLKLLEEKIIDKETFFNYINNTWVVYIKKVGSRKNYKYYIYSSLKECCKNHEVGIIDGFHMFIRIHTNNKTFPYIKKSQFEIQALDDLDLPKDFVFENRYHKQKPKKYKYTTKKRSKPTISVHTCDICGYIFKSYSRTNVCADCKRKQEEEKKSKGKTEKTCPICGKQHYRGDSPYCTNNCANKARNIRRLEK
jgi:rubrerythrin